MIFRRVCNKCMSQQCFKYNTFKNPLDIFGTSFKRFKYLPQTFQTCHTYHILVLCLKKDDLPKSQWTSPFKMSCLPDLHLCRNSSLKQPSPEVQHTQGTTLKPPERCHPPSHAPAEPRSQPLPAVISAQATPKQQPWTPTHNPHIGPTTAPVSRRSQSSQRCSDEGRLG